MLYVWTMVADQVCVVEIKMLSLDSKEDNADLVTTESVVENTE